MAAQPPPLARRAYSPLGSAVWGALAALATVASVAGLVIVNSGVSAYQAGRTNADEPFIFTRSDVLWLAAWLVGSLFLLVTTVARRGAVRFFALGGLLAGVTVLPVSCATRELPSQRYTNGFVEWTAARVDERAIRAWAAALPPVTALTAVPAAQWPREINTLAPAAVEQQPGARGVTIQWGRLAAWGTSRKVFIASDPNDASPPRDAHHAWTQVSPGLYAAVQERG
jgi:hypothetical protein